MIQYRFVICGMPMFIHLIFHKKIIRFYLCKFSEIYNTEFKSCFAVALMVEKNKVKYIIEAKFVKCPRIMIMPSFWRVPIEKNNIAIAGNVLLNGRNPKGNISNNEPKRMDMPFILSDILLVISLFILWGLLILSICCIHFKPFCKTPEIFSPEIVLYLVLLGNHKPLPRI